MFLFSDCSSLYACCNVLGKYDEMMMIREAYKFVIVLCTNYMHLVYHDTVNLYSTQKKTILQAMRKTDAHRIYDVL